jgi:adenylylsulfate kinase-like enzyme
MKSTTLIWITGLAGSGKTTIGKGVFQKLKEKELNTIFVDGDQYRKVFGASGYTKAERLVVAKNIVKLCKFLIDQNINVVCCTISLFKEIHEQNKKQFKNYYEIFVSCEIEELIKRDQKGLYSKALKGEINNVVGVDIKYNKPLNPFLIIDNNKKDGLTEKIDLICKKIL